MTERERLMALLAALEDPTRAAAFPADDPLLMAVARHHRLSPLLSISCGETLPAPLAETFRRDRVVTAARNMMLGQVAEECLRALAAADIPTIVLKGLDYETRLYDVVGARPTADVDLLVPDEKRRAAFGVLDRLGFEPRAAAPGFDDPDYHEVAWTRAGAEVDLHMALAPLARCRIDYRGDLDGGRALLSWAARRRWRWTDPTPRSSTRCTWRSITSTFPAIYLVDLARLLPDDAAVSAAEELATRWRCRRPLDTAISLAAAFLPGWRRSPPTPLDFAPVRARIVARYGVTTSLPRPEQLVRKLAHFDGLADAAHYLLTQSRRNLSEQIARRTLNRSARQRLHLVGAERRPTR